MRTGYLVVFLMKWWGKESQSDLVRLSLMSQDFAAKSRYRVTQKGSL